MSADNGWILRKNSLGEFVVQEYFASEDSYPSIDNVPISQVFDKLEKALSWYERHADDSEYGLTVKIQKMIDEKEKTNSERVVIVIEYDVKANTEQLFFEAVEQVRQHMHHPDQPNTKVIQVYAAIKDDAQRVLAVFNDSK